ncbi:DUF4913 domain-containing protein [Pseudarthrobacter sp. H3Y2-7]|uniref:DUF4913 domain-containing protein n=1 Tax=Pseudarthrobacter naphthalenicus TaxID=3031328 RepID=UPI0023AFE74A|nr:DUF4913 domain-containing protein [Pseudarthrobacter sp. H3Y2-7]MDE8670706.1 DUF4913 domain-containing protein [Pseudarthrobacter sp. H3Y2-7]
MARSWWRDHAAHHMDVLLSVGGPFKGCIPVADGHAANKLKALPYDPPPNGSFEAPQDSLVQAA